MKTQFSDVTIGSQFTFFDQTFRKVASGMAEDEENICHVFLPDTEVEIEMTEMEAKTHSR